MAGFRWRRFHKWIELSEQILINAPLKNKRKSKLVNTIFYSIYLQYFCNFNPYLIYQKHQFLHRNSPMIVSYVTLHTWLAITLDWRQGNRSRKLSVYFTSMFAPKNLEVNNTMHCRFCLYFIIFIVLNSEWHLLKLAFLGCPQWATAGRQAHPVSTTIVSFQ